MTIRELRARIGLTQAGGYMPPAYLVELVEYRVTHDLGLTGSRGHDKMHSSGGEPPVD